MLTSFEDQTIISLIHCQSNLPTSNNNNNNKEQITAIKLTLPDN